MKNLRFGSKFGHLTHQLAPVVMKNRFFIKCSHIFDSISFLCSFFFSLCLWCLLRFPLCESLPYIISRIAAINSFPLVHFRKLY